MVSIDNFNLTAGTAAAVDSSLCEDGIATLTHIAETAPIQWQSSPAGAGTWTTISALDTLTIPLTSSLDFRVFVSIPGCSDTSALVPITVDQRPEANVGPDQNLCNVSAATVGRIRMGTHTLQQNNGVL